MEWVGLCCYQMVCSSFDIGQREIEARLSDLPHCVSREKLLSETETTKRSRVFWLHNVTHFFLHINPLVVYLWWR